MSETLDTGDTTPAETETTEESVDELRAQIDLLQEENRRLRNEYARAKQTSYRRVAAGLGVIGLAALGGAAVFPPVRNVFIVLGGIGLFSGILTWYLTPEQFVAAEIGERVYTALASNEASIISELGLSDTRIYVPSDETTSTATVYIPQPAEATVESGWDQSNVFIIGSDGVPDGVAFEPTGAPLYREFERTAGTTEPPQVEARIEQISEALVEVLELTRSADIELDTTDGRATITVTEPAIGTADSFDDPVSSFVAVGVAETLDVPVQVIDQSAPDESEQYTVTVRWNPESVADELDITGTAPDSPDSEEAS